MRYKYQATAQDGTGRFLAGATITVYLANSTTLATIYDVASGGSAVSGSVVTSDATTGWFEFYVDENEYPHSQQFKITLAKGSRYNTQTWDYIQIFPDNDVTLLTDSTVDQGDDSIVGTLAWHITNAAGSATSVIVLAGTHTVSTSTTVPATMTLKIEPGGVLTDDASNATLTINGPIDAGVYQIFNWGTGSGSVAIGAGYVNEAYPEWWGPNTTPGTTDMTAEIQAAADAFPKVVFQDTTYEATHIDLNDDNYFLGKGWSSIIHQVTGTDVRTTADGLFAINKDNTDGSVDSVVIRDLQLQADVLTSAHAGTDEHNHLIMTGNAVNLYVDSVFFNGWKGDAICLGAQGTPTVASVAENITVTHCLFDGQTNKTRQGISILSAKNVFINHNKFQEVTAAGMPGAIAIEPELVTAYAQNITIENNDFLNIGPSGTRKPPLVIDLGNCDNTYLNRRNRISFTNNYVNTARMIIVKSVGATDTAEESQAIKINDNVFETVTGTGLFSPAYGVSLLRNTFIDCGQINVGADTYLATSVKIKDNIFDKCQNGGATITLLYADDVEIDGNSFVDCGADGGVGINVIYMATSTVYNLRIRNNVFSTPGSVTTGVAVYNNGATQDAVSVLENNILEDGIGLSTGWTAGFGGDIVSTVTLTTSQINNLRATPIQLVATPGAGAWIEFRGATLSYNYTTTAFTVGADEDFVIRYDGGAGTDLTASIESAGFIDQTNDEIRHFPASAWTVTDDVVSVANKKVEIFNTGAGETADGGTSTIIVKVTYRIHATGL